ncbi:MAG: hypothetical protein JXM70_26840 [Pirellulales bacterium]|nr:hypothetical protein [Pirellulales bacterium]
MLGRIALAAGIGLLLLFMAVVWLDAVQPYVANRLALQQMQGDEVATAALRASGRLASYMPMLLSCTYMVCCLTIFCVRPNWIRRVFKRRY